MSTAVALRNISEQQPDQLKWVFTGDPGGAPTPRGLVRPVRGRTVGDAAMPERLCQCGCGMPVGNWAPGVKGERAQRQKRYLHGHGGAEARRERKPVCSLAGCDRPNKARGLCQMHYARELRRGDVGPAEMLRCQPTPEGYKLCPGCGELKATPAEFYVPRKHRASLP